MSHQPYISEKTDLREFTLRALLVGLVLTVILGAANAYLGLRAGMTIAATYPAAVIGMAVLRIMRGPSWRRTSPGPSAPSASPWPPGRSSPSRPSSSPGPG
jgi:uncharacterized oligopeptide transporter (OPT) family protein